MQPKATVLCTKNFCKGTWEVHNPSGLRPLAKSPGAGVGWNPKEEREATAPKASVCRTKSFAKGQRPGAARDGPSEGLRPFAKASGVEDRNLPGCDPALLQSH